MTKLYTQDGVEHGLIDTLPNSVKAPKMERMSEKKKKEMAKLQEEEDKEVVARYINHNGDQPLIKTYMRWAGDPIRTYKFLPNYEYRVPLGLVKEINGSKKVNRSKTDNDNSNLSAVESETKSHELVPASFS